MTASFHPCLTFDYNEDEMMHASVADIKWNAPKDRMTP